MRVIRFGIFTFKNTIGEGRLVRCVVRGSSFVVFCLFLV